MMKYVFVVFVVVVAIGVVVVVVVVIYCFFVVVVDTGIVVSGKHRGNSPSEIRQVKFAK